MNRGAKQIIYGLFYLVVLFLTISAAYYLLLPRASCSDNKLNQNEEQIDCGGSCVPCVLKNLQPLQIFPANIFYNGDGTVSVLAEVLNKNEKLGVKKLPYFLNLYSKDNEKTFSTAKETFIYPGATKYIMEAGIAVDQNLAAKAELVFSETNWEIMEKPVLPLPLTNLKIKPLANQIFVSGQLRNVNPFLVSLVEIQGFLFNQLGLPASVSKTTLRNIEATSESDFILTFSLKPEIISSIDFSKTKITIEAKK